MGKIFSWEQIVNREVPSMIDFRDMKNLIETSLLGCDGVVGAAFCGSILKNEANVRSDIDVVVVYSKEWREAIKDLLQMIMVIANSRFVPIEFIIVDDELAKTDGHGIFRSFYEHLAFSADRNGVIKIDPRELIASHYDIINETLHYIRRKRSTMEKRMTTFLIDCPEKYYFLEKLMAAPVYVARKVIRSLDRILLVCNDSKKEVIKQYQLCFNGDEQWEILDKVNKLDQKYSQELEKQIIKPDKRSYQNLIKEIEAIESMVVDFLKINYVLVKELC